ncbi:hypothetical protein L6164_029528 [Bauhinia variegata]|uniref:Uncharacterized protein n=1 Tax=Bauhinia variegata TaxID=167791 RepID=A0ACB9L909_BAUVA|nr:hypothetical protein L6164_029528 [Bauhinia variegata]
MVFRVVADWTIGCGNKPLLGHFTNFAPSDFIYIDRSSIFILLCSCNIRPLSRDKEMTLLMAMDIES